jgi:hypothetical protein
MILATLTDEELVQLVQLNWNSCNLEKELAKRLSKRILIHANYENKLSSIELLAKIDDFEEEEDL